MDATTAFHLKKDRRSNVRWTWSESVRDAFELEAAQAGEPSSRYTENLALLGHYAKSQGMKLPVDYDVARPHPTPPEAA